MLLLDIPPFMHRVVRRHRVVSRDHVDHRGPRHMLGNTGAMRLPVTHHECLTCGKVWMLDG
jgi:hypothetical protein